MERRREKPASEKVHSPKVSGGHNSDNSSNKQKGVQPKHSNGQNAAKPVASNFLKRWLSHEVIAVIVLTLLALATRFYRIEEPQEVVFDEVHFGSFMLSYLKREYFFDIHPPLGKLLLAGAGWVVGVSNYTDKQFSSIGKPFPDMNYIVPRGVSAILSTLTVPLMFGISRQMGRSLSASILTAALFIADGVILVTSRFIMTDSSLWFFGVFSLYCSLRLWKTEDENTDKPNMKAWWTWCILTGFGMGCTVSVKWTGLGVVATIGVAHLLRTFTEWATATREADKKMKEWHWWRACRGIFGGVLMLTLMVAIYWLTWVIHFQLLVNSGPGDIWHGPAFLASLENSGHELPADQQPYTLLDKIVEIHYKMFEANRSLQKSHSYGSNWHNWPIMEKEMAYWVKNVQGGRHLEITLRGNAAVFAATTAAVLLMGAFLLGAWTRWDDETLTNRQRTHCVWASWLAFGYAINILPFVLVTRVCFLYHYIPSLIFGILLAGQFVDKYFKDLERNILVGFLLAAATYFFLINCHVYYA